MQGDPSSHPGNGGSHRSYPLHRWPAHSLHGAPDHSCRKGGSAGGRGNSEEGQWLPEPEPPSHALIMRQPAWYRQEGRSQPGIRPWLALGSGEGHPPPNLEVTRTLH